MNLFLKKTFKTCLKIVKMFRHVFKHVSDSKLFKDERRQSSKALHRTNESKQLEATLITQASRRPSIKAPNQWIALRPCRPRSLPREAGLGTWSDLTGDDGSFFLEPKLTMVISHCRDHGSVEGAEVCIQ